MCTKVTSNNPEVGTEATSSSLGHAKATPVEVTLTTNQGVPTLSGLPLLSQRRQHGPHAGGRASLVGTSKWIMVSVVNHIPPRSRNERSRHKSSRGCARFGGNRQ